MTTTELRQQIHKAVDNVPETILPDVLSILNGLQSNETGQIAAFSDLKKILNEDKALLERLAQ